MTKLELKLTKKLFSFAKAIIFYTYILESNWILSSIKALSHINDKMTGKKNILSSDLFLSEEIKVNWKVNWEPHLRLLLEIRLLWIKIKKSSFTKEATWIPLREFALGNSCKKDTLAFKEVLLSQNAECHQRKIKFCYMLLWAWVIKKRISQ